MKEIMANGRSTPAAPTGNPQDLKRLAGEEWMLSLRRLESPESNNETALHNDKSIWNTTDHGLVENREMKQTKCQDHHCYEDTLIPLQGVEKASINIATYARELR